MLYLTTCMHRWVNSLHNYGTWLILIVVPHNKPTKESLSYNITWLRFITMLCGTNNISWNIHMYIPMFSLNVGNILEYYVEYRHSHRTFLWIWIMLWIFSYSPINVFFLGGGRYFPSGRQFKWGHTIKHAWQFTKRLFHFINIPSNN